MTTSKTNPQVADGISRGMTQKQLADALGLKYPRDLERRCRNAEKLLDECRSIMAANGLYPSTQKRVSAHLAAAAQEDGK